MSTTDLIWLVSVNLLPLAAVCLLASARLRSASPWLALATVVVGSAPAFVLSATLLTYGSAGADPRGVHTLVNGVVTAFYGLLGLGIFFGCVRLQPVAFAPLGAVAAGLITIAAFYEYIPPFNSGSAGTLVFAAPAFVLVIYGVYLWYRNGLSGTLRTRGWDLRLAIALGIVSGFGAIGLLLYQSEPNRPNWTIHPIDFSRVASSSVLVVEGEVVRKATWSTESRRPHGAKFTITSTLYQLEVSEVWRGEDVETIHIAVEGYSPVDLAERKPYLLFLSGKADQEDFPSHWSMFNPSQVWTVDGDSFHSHFGLHPATSLSRQELAELLAANPPSQESAGQSDSIGITLGRAVLTPTGRVTVFYVTEDVSGKADGAVVIESATITDTDGRAWLSDGYGELHSQNSLTLGWLTFPVSGATQGRLRVTANSVQAGAGATTGPWQVVQLRGLTARGDLFETAIVESGLCISSDNEAIGFDEAACATEFVDPSALRQEQITPEATQVAPEPRPTPTESSTLPARTPTSQDAPSDRYDTLLFTVCTPWHFQLLVVIDTVEAPELGWAAPSTSIRCLLP